MLRSNLHRAVAAVLRWPLFALLQITLDRTLYLLKSLLRLFHFRVYAVLSSNRVAVAEISSNFSKFNLALELNLFLRMMIRQSAAE